MSLLDMLRYRRPDNSKTEREFIRRWILPLGVTQDKRGNLIKAVPNEDGSRSRIMWSSHTDTVHKTDGYQKLGINRDFVWTEDANSNCLGADCTTGVWLMIEMIKANKPGLYVFHRAEESGGIGSKWINDNTPDLLKDIDACIAFDRKDTGSIITHQRGTRCCSEAFVTSLNEAIGLNMKADPTGSFTDSASYTTKIPECTNISVGYYSQHGANEYQDLRFAATLLDALLWADFSKLTIERDPTAKPVYRSTGGYNRGRNHAWDDGYDYYNQQHAQYRAQLPAPIKPKAEKSKFDATFLSGVSSMKELLENYSDEVADVLEEHGLTVSQLAYEIWQYQSTIKTKVA